MRHLDIGDDLAKRMLDALNELIGMKFFTMEECYPKGMLRHGDNIDNQDYSSWRTELDLLMYRDNEKGHGGIGWSWYKPDHWHPNGHVHLNVQFVFPEETRDGETEMLDVRAELPDDMKEPTHSMYEENLSDDLDVIQTYLPKEMKLRGKLKGRGGLLDI
jgi:hypothetical protein